ncbi:MAG TPA: HEAT repeat domain-containing protein, partial [Gemmatimonadales bacterium]|nr:HEAT repeat domain-containing protein [Gemmatimonadales bacterium]
APVPPKAWTFTTPEPFVHIPSLDWDHGQFDTHFEFDRQFEDFKFELNFDHDFNFDFDHNFEWAGQGLPTPVAPLPPMSYRPSFGLTTPGTRTLFGEHEGMERFRPEQGTPEDSLYRRAREALNRGEYTRASTLFQSLEQRYPRSRVAPAALYYRAFALYRAGGTDELRTAVAALKAQQERYPEAASDPDAAALRTRLYAALAARGDAQAVTALRAATAGGPTCDKEDVEVRAEALNALAQINPPEARPTLKKVLARRDECSVRLRRSAVYILGRNGSAESAADLLEVVKTDPDPSVRSDAIMMLARSPGAETVRVLETIFNESTEDRTRQAALAALRNKEGPEATRVLRGIIERADVSERMRAEAVSQLAGRAVNASEVRTARSGQTATGGVSVTSSSGSGRPVVPENSEEAAYLRSLYEKSTSASIKSSIISALGRMGGTTNEQFLLGIVKDREEETRLRRDALSRLRVSALSIDELGKLFEALSERDLRSAVIRQLATRKEPEALDKLVEIIKSGTDPQIRKEAVAALARRDDPRATKLLLELVEKP